MKRRISSSFICIFLFMAMVLTVVGGKNISYAKENKADIYLEVLESYGEVGKYVQYLNDLGNTSHPEGEYVIQADSYVDTGEAEVATISDFMGKPGSVIMTGDNGYVTWEVDIKEAGLYNISISYYPTEGNSSQIQRAVFINDTLPFAEASTIEFSRVWKNATEQIKKDNQGNQIRPQQVEAPRWCESSLYDSNGFFSESLKFFFEEGINTLTFYAIREPVVIEQIKIYQQQDTPDYETVYQKLKAQGVKDTSSKLIEIEAETADYKSVPMLYPMSDNSSPSVSPYSASTIMLNTIGGERWNGAEQWLEWEFDISEDGFYYIGYNLKQNYSRGAMNYRKIMIDGEVPFTEVEAVGYGFKSGWRQELLGGDDPYRFYLTEGRHTLRIEVVLGEIGEYINMVEDSVKNLNEVYRKVVMVTGPAPDIYRDYQIAKKLPNLYSELQYEYNKLTVLLKNLQDLLGQKSDREAVINTAITQLNFMLKDIETVPKYLKPFKDSIGGLSTWIQASISQPIALDTIYIMSPNKTMPKLKDGFFDKLKHEFLTLFYSFIIDYNSIGNVVEDTEAKQITVWVGTGRDQANTMKTLIDDDFTVNTGIGVNLMLVQMDTLLPATLSGQGPDVAMQVWLDLPMNYGMRGAVADISKFPDFDKVTKNFYDSALVPFRFNDMCFALPETQSFNMMFYRKDILKELGLKPPQDWTEVRSALSVLSKNYMAFGMLPDDNTRLTNIFGMFLYQNGGQFYKEGGKASALSEEQAVNAFKEYTEYYTDYGLERDFDFVNRFRTGEMPLAIADYSVYNALQVAAPEIKGLWGFTTVPGTRDENGVLQKQSASVGLSVIMMEQAKDKDSAWEFMKWWTSTDIQIRYGREMEGLMGAAARYNTANIEALKSLPWPTQDYQNLSSQFEHVMGLPQVPGGYFTNRNVNNAFYKVVVDKKEGPREALLDYVRYIDDEIAYKRREFGLDAVDD